MVRGERSRSRRHWELVRVFRFAQNPRNQLKRLGYGGPQGSERTQLALPAKTLAGRSHRVKPHVEFVLVLMTDLESIALVEVKGRVDFDDAKGERLILAVGTLNQPSQNLTTNPSPLHCGRHIQ